MQTAEQKREYNRLRYYKNREKYKAMSMRWYMANREKEIMRRRLSRGRGIDEPILPYGAFAKRGAALVNCKERVLKHYGERCACCSEVNTKLLTVDHIENNGREHKGNGRHRYRGNNLYRYLVKHQFPTGIQILCFNCNIGRKNNGGICPHKG